MTRTLKDGTEWAEAIAANHAKHNQKSHGRRKGGKGKAGGGGGLDLSNKSDKAAAEKQLMGGLKRAAGISGHKVSGSGAGDRDMVIKSQMPTKGNDIDDINGAALDMEREVGTFAADKGLDAFVSWEKVERGPSGSAHHMTFELTAKGDTPQNSPDARRIGKVGATKKKRPEIIPEAERQRRIKALREKTLAKMRKK